jgi:hypothetical protein
MPKLWGPLVHKGVMTDDLGPADSRLVALLLFIPGILGMMMFAQFSKNQAWLARWPMAIVIGSFSGAAVTGFAAGDFIPQIQANLLPIISPGSWNAVMAASGMQATVFALLNWIANPILIVGVFCCLIYFFFSKEHRGATGAAATVGIWFLMVSFGASYGRTVATRVSLYLERAVFLLKESTVIGGHELAHWKVTLGMGLAIIAFLVVWFGVLKKHDEVAPPV